MKSLNNKDIDVKQTFTTARALAFGIELVGWVIVTLAVVGTIITLNTGNIPTGVSALMIVAAGSVAAATGLGLVLVAQLVQAQVATAINTGQILEHVANLKTQTTRTTKEPQITAQRHAPLTARPEPYTAKPQAEGRFLRIVKGYELHKYSDGISVGGEGRYPTILAAEKRAAELAAGEQ